MVVSLCVVLVSQFPRGCALQRISAVSPGAYVPSRHPLAPPVVCTHGAPFRWRMSQRMASQVKLLLPKFHRNRTRKYNNTALFGGGCWVSGASWGWPSQARHKRPRSTPIATLVFSPVLLFVFKRQSRICSHMSALQFSTVLPGLEPVSCELGLIETTEPTGGTHTNKESIGVALTD